MVDQHFATSPLPPATPNRALVPAPGFQDYENWRGAGWFMTRARQQRAVQKMLGHASAAMTLDIYADLFDDDWGGQTGVRPADR
jgi:hypothetical protein